MKIILKDKKNNNKDIENLLFYLFGEDQVQGFRSSMNLFASPSSN